MSLPSVGLSETHPRLPSTSVQVACPTPSRANQALNPRDLSDVPVDGACRPPGRSCGLCEAPVLSPDPPRDSEGTWTDLSPTTIGIIALCPDCLRVC